MKSNYNNTNPPSSNLQEEEEELLTLTLSTRSANPPPSHDPPHPPPPDQDHSTQCRPPRRHTRGGRLKQSPTLTNKSDTIPPPYPWATTNKRTTVHTLHYLLSNGLDTISSQVQCKKCDKIYDIEYDLKDKFMEVASFISSNKGTLHHRAPDVWTNPNFPSCKYCEQHDCVKPIILSKNRSINWLFLLLGQMLGCCKLAQLKYFCKHTKNHRTGAKDRLLYLTYLCLCKQLDPQDRLIIDLHIKLKIID